jgi:hypothetical protein
VPLRQDEQVRLRDRRDVPYRHESFRDMDMVALR